MSDDEEILDSEDEEDECDVDSDQENQDEDDLTTTARNKNVDSFKGIDRSTLFKTLREKHSDKNISKAKDFNRESLINLLLNGIDDLESQTWKNEIHPYQPSNFKSIVVPEEISPKATPCQIWRSYFDNDLLEFIVLETNKYIRHRGRLQQCHKLFHEQDINQEILLIFFSALISSCFFKLPSIPLYWEKSFFNIQAVNSLISVEQFKFILTNLHFSEPIDQPKPTVGRPSHNQTYIKHSDPIYKIRKVIEAMRTNFKKVYTPTCELAIDESIVPNKKRVGNLLQYIKNKPDRWGYKIWKLVDANGYLFDFNIYLGKETKEKEGVSQKTPGEKAVLDLIDGCKTKLAYAHELYMDNYFTTINLAEELFTNYNMYMTGTILENRLSIPLGIFQPTLKEKGDNTWMVFSKEIPHSKTEFFMSLLRIKDSKTVMFLSTKFQPTEEVDYLSDRSKKINASSRQHQTVLPSKIPLPMAKYRQNMGFVDTNDQLVKQYAFIHHSRRWYMSIFWYLFECSIVNAWKLHLHLQQTSKNNPESHPNNNNPQYRSLFRFRLELAKTLSQGRTLRTYQSQEANKINNRQPIFKRKKKSKSM